MDNNNEVFSEPCAEALSEMSHNLNQHAVISNQASVNRTPIVPAIVEEVDELLVELDSRYKTLTNSIVDARQICNKIKEKKIDCKKSIELQEQIITQLRSNPLLASTNSATNDEISNHKQIIKQNYCLNVINYTQKISEEIDANPKNIPTLIKSVREELAVIEAKGELVVALQELNNLFQQYKQLQQHSESAENRFQTVLKIFGDNKTF